MQMRRACLFLLLLAPAVPSSAQEEPPLETEEEVEATLTQVKGSVYLHTFAQAAGEFIEADEDSPLQAGDHVRTGTDGTAEVDLADKSVIELGRNTDFIINSLDPAETEFHLGIGSLVAKLKKLLGGDHMTFHTPTAVCAVRGTELALAQESDSQPTRVGVFDEGLVAVRSQNGKEEVQVGPGEETQVGHKGPPARARAMRAFLAHRDVLAQARKNLAGLPGRWKSRPLAQRLAFREAFAKKRALRAEKLANMRSDMRLRVYDHLQKRRQMIQERRAKRQQRRQQRQMKRRQKQQRPQRGPFKKKRHK